MVLFRTVTIFFGGLVFLFSCHSCGSRVLIDNGKIPDSILAFVPYQNGQSYQFRHSAGLVIRFSSARQSREEWSLCPEYCKYETKYEVNSTTLTPDYPVFNFECDLSNLDTVHLSLTAIVGHYWFHIPINDYQSNYCDFADSVLIGKKYYHDVFKIKSDYGFAWDRDTIFADSMYYSYRHGIIQVMMSNGEKYTIYE